MTKPTKPEAHRWGFYAAVLAVGLLLSMAGNAVHVWSQWHADVAAGVDRGTLPPWVPTAAIMVVPAMVMVMTEMVVISYRRNAGWARTVTTALAGLVGVVSLTVSYVGLVHVCTVIVGLPTVLGYVAPVIVDAPIIAATVGLWDVQQKIRADRELADRSDEHSTDSTDSTDAVEQSTDAADRSNGLSDSADRADEHSDHSAEQSIDCSTGPELDGQRSIEPDEQLGRPDELTPDEWSTEADDLVAEQVGRHSVDRTSGPDEQSIDRPDELDEQSDELDEQSDEYWSALAERVRSATGITAEPVELATVLQMSGEGATRSEIAEAVGRSKSTVSGWITKAATVDPDPSPVLTAVR